MRCRSADLGAMAANESPAGISKTELLAQVRGLASEQAR